MVGCASMPFSQNDFESNERSGSVFVSELPTRDLSDIAKFSSQDIFKVGDKVEMNVYRVESLDGIFNVERDGVVDFPLIGEVKVSGLSTGQLRRELEFRYGSGLIKEPSISINIEKTILGRFVVDGAVEEPGVFEIFEVASISEAIALAGGLTLEADKDDVFLIREVNGEQKMQRLNLHEIRISGEKGPEIYPNDIVFVQSNALRLTFNDFMGTIPLLSAIIFASTR